MNEPLPVDVFVEDHAHEFYVGALLRRLAREEGKALSLTFRSARGGQPRVLSEVGLYERFNTWMVARIVVIVVDANCKGHAERRKEISASLGPTLSGRAIVACPDPHVERWYLADPDGFAAALGTRPQVGRKKCERGRYKRLLSEAVRTAGYPAPLGGIEFAPEIVEKMDIYRACRNERSLKQLIDDFTNALRAQ